MQEHLEKLGWTQADAAEILRVNPATISRWVAGASQIPPMQSAILNGYVHMAIHLGDLWHISPHNPVWRRKKEGR